MTEKQFETLDDLPRFKWFQTGMFASPTGDFVQMRDVLRWLLDNAPFTPPEEGARIFCLEDALRPFAMLADTMYHLKDDDKVCGMYVAWFRYAAKVMHESSEPQEKA